jgi:outer membrane usher protein
MSSPTLGTEAQRAILQLTVNLAQRGEVLVILREDDALVRVADLGQAGLRASDGRREMIDGEAYVSLRSLHPRLEYEIDERSLVLQITAQPDLLAPTTVNFRPGPPAGLVHARAPAAFLNYSVTALDFAGFTAFGEAGVSLNGALLFSGFSRTEEGDFVRGLSNLTIDDHPRLTRWILGDHFASAAGLGGAVVLGGLSASREFSLNPYFITYPAVGLSGAVLNPSTAEVFIGDRLLRRTQLPPGPFVLQNLPVPTGSGTTRIVLRDAFGREQEILTPYYFTSALLDAGLHEYSYNIGFRRENLGIESADYGSLAFLGRHHVGLTDSLTAGLRLELDPELVSGGPTVTGRLPVGEGEISLAASRDGERQGLAASLGYRFSGRPVSFGATLRGLSRHYATLSLEADDDRAQIEAIGFVGTALGPRVNVTAQYSYSDFRDSQPRDRLSIFATIRLSKRAALILNASRSRQRGGDTVDEMFGGLSYFFGGNTTGMLSYERSGADTIGTVSLQKSLPVGTGFGYRVRASATGDQQRGTGLLQYQGPYGRYEALVDADGERVSTNVTVSGGVVAIGGRVFPTRAVQESFALVRVPGVTGVRGYVNNQEIGRTDARGDLPVPSLLAYYGNRLSIAQSDIPLDYNIDAIEKTVATPFRGGATVEFPVERRRSLSGTVVLQVAGAPVIPVYGQLTVTAGGKAFESPIGASGEFYFENVPAGRHPAEIQHKGRTCSFTFEVPAVAEAPVVDLGAIQCAVP